MNNDDLERLILDTIDIPSLPPIALRVLQLARKENTSMGELEATISGDQAFAARVLRIANSPFYRGQHISSIAAAVSLIGFDAMISLVTGAAMRDLYRKNDPFDSSLWDHSLGVSLAASLLAGETGMAKPEDALAAGLLHDIGKALLNRSIPGTYADIVEMTGRGGYSFSEAETAVLGYDHCSVGGVVARLWNLPPLLEVVIERHHTHHFPGFAAETHRDLCAVVAAADALCLQLGIGPRSTPSSRETGLGLTKERMREMQREFSALYNKQREHLME
ncbi:MAG: HDOD domain-containing protein [Nitrospirota bacterium]